MNFVAIDFETANATRGSACEIGIVVVEDWHIVENYSLLIKPRDNWFHFFNTKLHGIDAKKVENEPEFDEIWAEIKDVFEGKNIIAHNAGFDIGVLRSSLEVYNLEMPNFQYNCSCRIAKKAWPDLISHSLNVVSEHLDIALDHHHARDDAEASARIVLAACRRFKVEHFEDLEKVFQAKTKQFNDSGSNYSFYTSPKKRDSIKDIVFERDKVDQGHLFYQKCIVFTGRLSHLVRKEAQKMVLEIGGSCASFIDGRTDYLVVGEKDYAKYKDGKTSSKLRTAEAMQSDGHRIEIISETEFKGEFDLGEEKIGGLFDGLE